MKRIAALLLLLAAAAVAAGALAQDRCRQTSGNRMEAIHARHQARLHDRLKLSEAQEAAWRTFVNKTRPDFARQKAVREELAALATPERMDRMLALMKEREGRMTARVVAVKEFYAQLTPEQQKTFDDQTKARFTRGPGEWRGAEAGGSAAAPSRCR